MSATLRLSGGSCRQRRRMPPRATRRYPPRL